MSRAPARLAGSAFALSLVATHSYADLAPAQVWGDWRAYIEAMGHSITATETVNADTLTVSDIVIAIDQQSATVNMGSLQFVQTSGGAVEILVPATLPITIDMAATALKGPAQIAMTYRQSGHRMIASGTPEAMELDYSADNFALALDSLTQDGTTFDNDNAQLSVSGDALSSQTTITLDEMRSYDQTMKADSLSYEVYFKDPDQIEAMRINSNLENINLAATSVLPLEGAAPSPGFAPLLTAGLAFEGALSADSTETQTEITSDDGTSKIKTGSQNSSFEMVMGQEGIRYGGEARDVQIGAQLAGLPFPLFAQMARSGVSLSVPVQKSDAPQNFALSFDMTDFTMSDIIWALFDPSGQLPRDPATIAADLTGKAKILVDMFDPEQAQALIASPGEISALTVNRLDIDAVGAKIGVQGDLAFDNTDKTTLPGFPKPVGDIEIDIAGANGLLDKLGAIGLLPPQQLTGARLMLGLFAVPGTSPDTLSTKIEFNEAGHILANGQRIK